MTCLLIVISHISQAMTRFLCCTVKNSCKVYKVIMLYLHFRWLRVNSVKHHVTSSLQGLNLYSQAWPNILDELLWFALVEVYVGETITSLSITLWCHSAGCDSNAFNKLDFFRPALEAGGWLYGSMIQSTPLWSSIMCKSRLAFRGWKKVLLDFLVFFRTQLVASERPQP